MSRPRTPPRSRRRFAPSACLVSAILLLAACGAAVDREDGSALGDQGSTPSDADSDDSGAGTDGADDDDGGGDDEGGDDGGGDDGFDWTDWGPSDPPIPGHYRALALSPPACDDAEAQAPDGDPFWRTVIAVCRAATDGGPWPTDTAVPDPPEADNAHQQCLDEELTEMLRRALRWHADNPGQEPDVVRAGSGATSDCQRSIYEVTLVDDDGQEPDGEVLAVTLAVSEQDQGELLPVRVDGSEVEHSNEVFVGRPGGSGMDTLVVVVPAELLDGSVEVEVTTSRGVLTTTAAITAPDGGGTSGESGESEESGDPEETQESPGAPPSEEPGSEPSGGPTGP